MFGMSSVSLSYRMTTSRLLIWTCGAANPIPSSCIIVANICSFNVRVSSLKISSLVKGVLMRRKQGFPMSASSNRSALFLRSCDKRLVMYVFLWGCSSKIQFVTDGSETQWRTTSLLVGAWQPCKPLRKWSPEHVLGLFRLLFTPLRAYR